MIETKFKQTEAGLIPEDWKVSSISEFTDIRTGGTPSTVHKEFWGGNIRWMNSGELNLKEVHDVAGRITELGFKCSSTKNIPKNCVLIGLAGQGKTRGTAAYNHVELCINQSIAAVLPNNIFESRYLYYYIDSIYDYLRAISSGDGGRGGLSKGVLLNIPIVLPTTLGEQQRIAEALSDIDALISSLGKMIEKKRNIKLATMQQLLTGKQRLPGFTEPWVNKKLEAIGSTYNGLSGKTANDFGRGCAKYVTFLNVLNNPIIDCKAFEDVNVGIHEKQNKVQKGDLLFNTSSETPEEVGICATLNEDVENLYLNSFCFGFRVNEGYSPLFLSYFFRGKPGRLFMTTLAQGSTRYNLSKDNMLKSSIFIPSSQQEQTAIANILMDMDNEIATLETRKMKYEAIKQGMMQQLLTGKIRLV